MSNRNSTGRYDGIAQLLHWVIAGLIVTQIVLAKLAEELPKGLQQLIMYARHKSVGMTVLMLAVVRLLWRALHPPPDLPNHMAPYERVLAKVTHVGLYTLLFAMPISGWIMSSAKNYPVSWFGIFTWPDLVAPNEDLHELWENIHGVLAKILVSVALLHIAAALKHHFWNKDDVLKRMLPFTGDGGSH
jgi:cytochrome b561